MKFDCKIVRVLLTFLIMTANCNDFTVFAVEDTEDSIEIADTSDVSVQVYELPSEPEQELVIAESKGYMPEEARMSILQAKMQSELGGNCLDFPTFFAVPGIYTHREIRTWGTGPVGLSWADRNSLKTWYRAGWDGCGNWPLGDDAPLSIDGLGITLYKNSIVSWDTDWYQRAEFSSAFADLHSARWTHGINSWEATWDWKSNPSASSQKYILGWSRSEDANKDVADSCQNSVWWGSFPSGEYTWHSAAVTCDRGGAVNTERLDGEGRRIPYLLWGKVKPEDFNFKIDSIAPTNVKVSLQGARLYCTAADLHSGVYGWRVYWSSTGETKWFNNRGSGSYIDIPSGCQEAIVTAYDKAGNLSNPVKVVLDAQPPKLSVKWSKLPIRKDTLILTGTDDIGVTGYAVSDTKLSSPITQASWQTSGTFTDRVKENKPYYCYVRDASGKWAEVVADVKSLDLYAPEISKVVLE